MRWSEYLDSLPPTRADEPSNALAMATGNIDLMVRSASDPDTAMLFVPYLLASYTALNVGIALLRRAGGGSATAHPYEPPALPPRVREPDDLTPRDRDALITGCSYVHDVIRRAVPLIATDADVTMIATCLTDAMDALVALAWTVAL